MAITNQQILDLKRNLRTLLPLTQARRQNLDTNVTGVTTNQPTGVDTGTDGGAIPYDTWRVCDAIIDALAAAIEPNTDAQVSATNFATRFAAQITATADSNLTITRNGNNFSIAGLNDEGIQDVVGDMLNVTLGSSGITFEYNDTTGKLDIDFSGITAGGSSLDASGLIALINNDEGNVDAAADSTGNKVKLTGPTAGTATVTKDSILAIIDNTAGNVDAAESANDSTKVQLTAPAAGTFSYLDYRAINSSDISGNSTTITAAWVNKRNTFRGTSLSADHTVSMESSIGANNQVLQITNEDADNTVTVSGDIVDVPDGQDPVLQKFEWIQLQKIGTGWRIVERGSLLSPTGSMSGTPDNAEQYYWGHQDSIPDGTWETTDAQDSQDVRTAGTTFTITITGIVDQDYYYFLAPNDRLPTRIVDGVGADRTTGTFTTVALNDLIGTTDFTAYYARNVSGYTLPLSLTITTA